MSPSSLPVVDDASRASRGVVGRAGTRAGTSRTSRTAVDLAARRGSRGCRRRSTATCSSTGIGIVLALLEELDQALAAGELALRGLVEVGAELGEGRQLAVLRQVEAQRAGDLLHGLDLGVAADARHRDADVDRRPHAGVEEVGLQEDLAVGDRDDVGRDVGRDVAGLGLDDRQRGERAAAELVAQLGRALEQAASAGRRRRRGRPRGPAAGAAAARSGGRPRRAWRGRRRCTAACWPL